VQEATLDPPVVARLALRGPCTCHPQRVSGGHLLAACVHEPSPEWGLHRITGVDSFARLREEPAHTMVTVLPERAVILAG
jgi:hypothetical protein